MQNINVRSVHTTSAMWILIQASLWWVMVTQLSLAPYPINRKQMSLEYADWCVVEEGGGEVVTCYLTPCQPCWFYQGESGWGWGERNY